MPDDGPSGGHAPDPFVVDPVRARDRRRSGRSALVVGAIAVLVIGLSAWGLLAPPTAVPAPSPTAASVAGPTTAPSPVDVATPDGGRGDDVALADLAGLAGWADCPIWRGFGVGAGVGPELVASERTRQGVTTGRLVVDDLFGGQVLVWLGDDATTAAEGLGGTYSVLEGDAVWTAIAEAGEPPVAVRLEPATLPGGGRYWQERARAMPAPDCLGDAVPGPPARVIDVPADADALARLFVATGMDACRTWQRMATADDGLARDVDAAADAAGIAVDGAGWIRVPLQPGYGERQTRIWVGADPAGAGASHGSDLVVLQAGDPAIGGTGRAWMAVRLDGRPAAVQLRVVETPAGRRAWLPTPSAAGTVGSCPVATSPDASPEVAGSDEGASAPTVELLRGGSDALSMLIDHFGWTGCRMTVTTGSATPPSPALVDDAARASGTGSGWLVMPLPDASGDPVRIWLGDDVVPLAGASNVTVVALDGTAEAWLADATRAVAWRATVTPDGRTAWFATGALVSPDAPCAGDVGIPDGIAGVRSFTCWTDRARCLEAVRTAIREAPDAFGAGTEVAAGLGDWCDPGVRCAWVGPNMPIVVTAAPTDWTSAPDVRVFTAGWRRLSLPFRELEAGEISPRVLAMASRPSLALPVSTAAATAAAYCPADGITGALHGSPWDPRVAWVGPNSVRWPAGFTVRFAPGVELVAPGGHVYREGDSLQVAGTAGAEPVFVACRVTGGT